MNKENQFTILIVDDIRTNIVLLAELLKNDYQIKVANNGKSALRIAHEEPKPDLIVLDIMMPEMDGYEVCRILKNDKETMDIPVIFITAMNDEKNEELGLELGAVDYITKPFVPGLVKIRVKQQLERKIAYEKLAHSLNETQKAYELLKTAQNKLIQLEQKNAVLAMAVTANHEINQPLMVLSGTLDVLKIKIDNSELDKYFEKADIAIQKIESILSKFSHIDQVQFKTYLDDVSMLDISKKNIE
ncbi:MAG TPA: response regulator [Candidatus Cloacimonadota bacterium]|nr:response regulator [Candidatus Cloacimonadota bacterium]